MEVLPEGTVTLAGNDAEELLPDNLTTTPPVPAELLSVTVPVDDVPPATWLGLTLSEASVADVIVRLAVFLTLPADAVMVTVFSADTATVFTLKEALL
jgi:hypothetical protein